MSGTHGTRGIDREALRASLRRLLDEGLAPLRAPTSPSPYTGAAARGIDVQRARELAYTSTLDLNGITASAPPRRPPLSIFSTASIPLSSVTTRGAGRTHALEAELSFHSRESRIPDETPSGRRWTEAQTVVARESRRERRERRRHARSDAAFVARLMHHGSGAEVRGSSRTRMGHGAISDAELEGMISGETPAVPQADLDRLMEAACHSSETRYSPRRGRMPGLSLGYTNDLHSPPEAVLRDLSADREQLRGRLGEVRRIGVEAVELLAVGRDSSRSVGERRESLERGLVLIRQARARSGSLMAMAEDLGEEDVRRVRTFLEDSGWAEVETSLRRALRHLPAD